MTESEKIIAFNLQSDADSEPLDDTLHFYTNPATKAEVKERAEELGFSSMSEAARYFLTLGMHAFPETDPRKKTADSSDRDYKPLTIREIIPEGEENALSLRNGEVLDKIDKHLADELTRDPKINRDGWEVWR
ncbi:hypothetical protein G6M89_21745 [Natronolimnobius sp. AArcel1]|uniref:hypothetical protein n=1 Tax=Natronolimnobius sp. AArcel1 TaxID=1679093 RepID=UPI0013ED350D|nr:hypothetical protein [Natronolimnobius sp. AArcel1]NGM71571.1 hypothetical protein [Natronolimnobius sp. AArcel1]